jgi:hypothetical protein
MQHRPHARARDPGEAKRGYLLTPAPSRQIRRGAGAGNPPGLFAGREAMAALLVQNFPAPGTCPPVWASEIAPPPFPRIGGNPRSPSLESGARPAAQSGVRYVDFTFSEPGRETGLSPQGEEPGRWAGGCLCHEDTLSLRSADRGGRDEGASGRRKASKSRLPAIATEHLFSGS